MRDYKVRSLVDVPVGDLCFSSATIAALDDDVEYLGIDIVPELVSEASRRFRHLLNVRFMQADLAVLTALVFSRVPYPRQPSTTLIFSRQMFQHQCNHDVQHELGVISRSGAEFALLTTFMTAGTNFNNTDIPCSSGGYRPQDLSRPPFSLPEPTAFWSEYYPADSRVGLGLWRLPFATIV